MIRRIRTKVKRRIITIMTTKRKMKTITGPKVPGVLGVNPGDRLTGLDS